MNNFAVFIISHGRADTMTTLDTIKKAGYSGEYYIVIDDTDSQLNTYLDRYGDRVIIFNKNHYINSVETISNKPNYSCTVYVKNAIIDIAKELKLEYYAVLDDDITALRFRLPVNNQLKSVKIHDLDRVLNIIVDMMKKSNMSACSFNYSTAYLAGISAFSDYNIQIQRYPNVFVICSVDNQMNWISDFGEDLIAGIQNNVIGNVIYAPLMLHCYSKPPAERLSGGMTDNYAQDAISRCMRYIVACPNVMTIQAYKGRIVGRINKRCAIPKIINGRYKV